MAMTTTMMATVIMMMTTMMVCAVTYVRMDNILCLLIARPTSDVERKQKLELAC